MWRKKNKIKDNLHIILYFFNYNEDRTLQGFELPIIKELCKNSSSKVIYVITHSDKEMDDINKGNKIRNINVGLQNLTKNSSIHYQKKKGGIIESNEKNLIFVEFHKDNKTKLNQFGINKLFRTFYNFFILTEDYKNSNKMMSQEYINENAKRLKAQAEAVLKAL